MAYVDRIKPEEYNALVVAFGKVGAPIFVRVAEIINLQRHAVGNPKTIAFTTLKKAWEKGWTEQVGGAPAPAIKTLFPHVRPVSYKHDAPEHVEPSPEVPANENKVPAALPGASPVAASDAASQRHVMVRHDEVTKTLETAMVPHASAEGLRAVDPLAAAILKLDEGRANALLNEMGILAAARQNIRGLQDIANVVIATLASRHDILKRLVGDLAHDDAHTLRTVRDTLRELGGVLKDLAATNKAIQESQRLLVGMPQRIEERRGAGARSEEEIEQGALARMAGMLRTRLEAGAQYDGEETGAVVQDAEVIEPANEAAGDEQKAAAGGEVVANSDGQPT